MSSANVCGSCKEAYSSTKVVKFPLKLEQCRHTVCMECAERMWNQQQKLVCPDCGREGRTHYRNLQMGMEMIQPFRGARSEECAEHGELVSFYCFDDHQLVCRQCARRDHSEHRAVNFEKAAKDVEPLLAGKHAQLQRTWDQVQRNIQSIQEQRDAAASNISSAIQEVYNRADTLINLVARRMEAAVSELQQAQQRLTDEYAGQQDFSQALGETLRQMREARLDNQQQILQHFSDMSTFDFESVQSAASEAPKFLMANDLSSAPGVVDSFFELRRTGQVVEQAKIREARPIGRGAERARESGAAQGIRDYRVVKMHSCTEVGFNLDASTYRESTLSTATASIFSYISQPDNHTLLISGGNQSEGENPMRLTVSTPSGCRELRLRYSRGHHTVQSTPQASFIVGGIKDFTNDSRQACCELFKGEGTTALPDIPTPVSLPGGGLRGEAVYTFGGLSGAGDIDRIQILDKRWRTAEHRFPKGFCDGKAAWNFERSAFIIYAAWGGLDNTFLYDLNAVVPHGPKYPMIEYLNANPLCSQGDLYTFAKEDYKIRVYDTRSKAWRSIP